MRPGGRSCARMRSDCRSKSRTGTRVPQSHASASAVRRCWRSSRTSTAASPTPDQVKPGNFMLSAQVADLGHPRGVDPQRFQLVAPYNPDPRQWLKMRWMDRYSGEKYGVTLERTFDARG